MSKPEFVKLIVDEKHPRPPKLPNDGAVIELCRKGVAPALDILFSNVTDAEASGFTSHYKCSIGMFNPDDKTIIFIFRFIDFFDVEAPFNVGLIDGEDLEIYDPSTRETRLLINATFTERNTSIIKGLRAFTLSPAFTRALVKAIKRQKEFSKVDIDNALDKAIAEKSLPEVTCSPP